MGNAAGSIATKRCKRTDVKQTYGGRVSATMQRLRAITAAPVVICHPALRPLTAMAGWPWSTLQGAPMEARKLAGKLPSWLHDGLADPGQLEV